MAATDKLAATAAAAAESRGPGAAPESGLVLCILLALAYNVFWLIVGIDNPVIEQFAFRQTQTAISTYWMVKDGLGFLYQTPVLGAPWEVPFEFPTYQLIVAALVKVSGLPIDAMGRGVSQFFFVLTAIPLYHLLRQHAISRESAMIVVCLFLTSPLYVFWGRSFMIESTALFFAISWLALLARYLAAPSHGVLVLALLAGCLGILTKATTFAVPGLLGAAMIIWQVRANRRASAYGLLVCALVFLVGVAWVLYSDAVKSAHPLAVNLTSTSLAGWNHGPLDLRMSAQFWVDLVVARMPTDAFGVVGLLALAFVLATAFQPRYRVPALVALLAGLLPLLIYTNLHVVHSYYQFASSVFVIVAVGLGVGAIREMLNRSWGLAAFAGLLFSQVFGFATTYANLLKADLSTGLAFNVAQTMGQLTKEDEAILVFGTDWSSIVPYYAGRKGVAMPYWASAAQVRSVLADPARTFGGRRLGAVVSCGVDEYGESKPLIVDYLRQFRSLATLGPCEVFLPVDAPPAGSGPTEERSPRPAEGEV